ncbi:Na+-transporting NADH:ubiquinone oxidoreductase subunit C [Desulfuromusa kysingii]|uniref:Na(+)-translocating NADH-quinone reductase subunit C n=1 Tax=Desulfuromusa kysingii TaxID=37625 RepID=A0A1H4BL54_9BACT|nr:Na(+)-translocating NADH-quinone reductase subunit C [Desulfuromusa kysingii]SEA48768.1 Na+-transporting NADH:ubiquinone oxidoreductase subunit C [Desulfuromusa kysingii]
MADITAYKPFYSVLVLAFFCSILVGGAAVGLRPLQEKNKLQDRRMNILVAAGLYDSTKSVEDLFGNIETRIIDLKSGDFVSATTVSPEGFDQLKAAMSEELGQSLSKAEDIVGIRRLERYSRVYLVMDDNTVRQVILPVRGKGLWSTLYGYIAIEGDMSTVSGISFYEHGETPGLGGEIENRRWQSGWQGKKIYNQSNEEALHVNQKKDQVEMIYHVDGLSGATLTTQGVDNIISFWFGELGFKPFLTRLRDKGGRIDG